MLHPSIYRRISHARQVRQPDISTVAPFVEGFYCVCALVVGQRRPSLDVMVVVQCGREEDHRHSRMCPVDSVMDISPVSRVD
ncbi:hypothetical protein PIB30_056604 [Stylosanthes scabra]|uniref:Uncharacterized protein n=1 Tax=Stylosanthes scabra TaxID=79078 RepID=A0ABU6VLF3_9FABA|nr:hypothetical protein [Stylosanthes scabra]